MASVLITGSSRGLGLELVKQMLTLPSTTIDTIYATSRAASPPEPLSRLITSSNNRIKHVQVDVTDPASVTAAAVQASRISEGKGLDIIINNAGTQSERNGRISAMGLSDLEFTMRISSPPHSSLYSKPQIPRAVKVKKKKKKNSKHNQHPRLHNLVPQIRHRLRTSLQNLQSSAEHVNGTICV